MRVRCLDSGRTYDVRDRATIGRAANVDITIDDPSLLAHHATLVASESQPGAWHLVSAGDDDEVNGRPAPGGITRLGVGAFSVRLRLGSVALECEHSTELRRTAATGTESNSRCPRCARPIAAGEELLRCECGAVAHAACAEGRCYRCGAREEADANAE